MAKPALTISQEMQQALEDRATQPFNPDGVTPLPNGMVQVEITADLMARLDRLRRPGESDNDLLKRMLFRDGQHRSQAFTEERQR